MDYSNILTRTWNIIWTHKYLLLLGVLVALGSGGGGFGTGGPTGFGGESGDNGFEFEGAPPELGQMGPLAGMAIGAIILLVGLALLIGLAVWAVSRVAGGGLIAAADTVDGGGRSSFGLAWQEGWAKGWHLIGIGLLMTRALGAALGGELIYRYTLTGAWYWLGIVTLLAIAASWLPARGATRISVRESLTYA